MVFGQRYYAELRSKFKDVFWSVEVAERGYQGRAEEMFFDGNSPLSITWENRGDEFFVPVKGSEATINILCHKNFHYLTLFTSDTRKFRVSIYRNTKLFWRGYLVADLYSENFTAPPYKVSIKAVDGFSLLSSIPFRNTNGTNLSGQKSLWSLISMCIDLLELDVNVADWLDLYAEGMSENSSPLRQTYINMERFYTVYNEPTFRDVLELCFRPFSAQIFQSNGALHIRRAISLYNDTRPYSFYSVGGEFPMGWLITANGESIVTAIGEPIITSTTRERIESIWDNDINVQDTSVMEIVPAVRKVSISVTNKMIGNLATQIGLFDKNKWNDPYEHLFIIDEGRIRFEGDSDNQGVIVGHKGFNIEQCSYPLNLEFTIQTNYTKWNRYGSSSNRGKSYDVDVEWGVKLVGTDSVHYLTDDGGWSNTETTILDKVNTATPLEKKIETASIPNSGNFIFFIKQNLVGVVTENSIDQALFNITNFSLTIDTGDDYEESLQYDTLVNQANNIDMAITLPVADIPNIPNDKLLYSLYFTDRNGKPTRMWHSKGGNDYNSLINHIVQCALNYRQRPSRRISGEMFTGKYIDMNTVVKDDKYLFAGFYINSIELNALDDNYNSELVEMPRLLVRPTPDNGDDCIKVEGFSFTIVDAIRCENQIVLQSSNRVYLFCTLSETIISVIPVTSSAKIFPADHSFVIVEGYTIKVVDYRGVVIHSLTAPKKPICATYMDGYVYVVYLYLSSRPGSTSGHLYLNRPEYKYSTPIGGRGDGATKMAGKEVKSIIKSFSSIVVNIEDRAYVHDKRTNGNLT